MATSLRDLLIEDLVVSAISHQKFDLSLYIFHPSIFPSSFVHSTKGQELLLVSVDFIYQSGAATITEPVVTNELLKRVTKSAPLLN